VSARNLERHGAIEVERDRIVIVRPAARDGWLEPAAGCQPSWGRGGQPARGRLTAGASTIS
jgi:hypothetical protein